jgi:thioester reductase-like protein
VAREFAALLDVETIGLDDDFLELGGHSLLLAQLASRLSHAYEVTIPVSRLFATPTVRGVSQLIEVCANEGTEAAAAMADRVDLLSEAALEPELTPAGLPPADYDDPRRVLLTGVTGFLGAHLLRELLEQTQAEVWCLVRASDDARAQDRVERTLRQYRMWDASFRPRIKGVPGDIAKPRLGLSTERFELLASTVDSIYHSAALVNFVYPYSTLKAPNVGGTKTLLELACLTRAKAFHHISAVDVFVRGEDRTLYEADPLEPRDVPAGYIQSKWVAEKMVATVRDRGLPVTIYRPWIILGHSEHGSAHTTDYTCVFLKGCVQLGAAPDIPMTLNVMPADYVSRAIVHISRQPAGRGGIFHFANPHAEDLATVWDWVRGYGYDLARMSYRDWHAKARTVSPDNALYKILPILIDGEEDLDTVSPENFRPRIDTSHTDAVLAGSGITCPPVSRELCDKVLDYLTDVDFLESPYDRSVL